MYLLVHKYTIKAKTADNLKLLIRGNEKFGIHFFDAKENGPIYIYHKGYVSEKRIGL